MDKIKSITFDNEAQNNLPKDVKDKMRKDRKQAEKEQLNLHGVSSSLDEGMTIEEHLQNIGKHQKRAKILFAIKTLKNAESENDVLDAIALKEELNWQEVDEELKDQWNDYFGDAKKYLP